MELELSVFSLRRTIEHGLALVRERAAVHRIAVTLEMDPSLDLIESDELRFKQVMLNLLSNAVKSTPNGGQVAVRAVRTDHRLSVTVTDNGIGIAREDRERIFESFQQGQRGPSREEGTGLGLTLCRRIVTLMGGTMSLETEVGVGSTFGFTVPLQGPRVSVGSGIDDDQDPVIVVIDDDRASVDLMSAYLAGHGVRVVRAHDGKEGLDAVRRLRPVATVLDILLPGIDGWELLDALQADPGSRALPGDHRLHRRRAVPRAGRRGSRLPGQARRPGRAVGCAAPNRRAADPERRAVGVMVARVLVVEDNPLNLKLIRDVLEYRGFEVLTAASGEEGVRRRVERLPGPGADGPELPGIDGQEALLRIGAESAVARYRWSR